MNHWLDDRRQTDDWLEKCRRMNDESDKYRRMFSEKESRLIHVSPVLSVEKLYFCASPYLRWEIAQWTSQCGVNASEGRGGGDLGSKTACSQIFSKTPSNYSAVNEYPTLFRAGTVRKRNGTPPQLNRRRYKLTL